MTLEKRCILTKTSNGNLILNKEFESVSKMAEWLKDEPLMYTDTIKISFKMLQKME